MTVSLLFTRFLPVEAVMNSDVLVQFYGKGLGHMGFGGTGPGSVRGRDRHTVI